MENVEYSQIIYRYAKFKITEPNILALYLWYGRQILSHLVNN
jgi:hypothetical protein